MNPKAFCLALAVFVLGIFPLRAATPVASTPPMGWNSFDSYGVYLYHEAAMATADKMAVMLKPFGYEYFVIDAGWFGEFEVYPGTRISKGGKHAEVVNINEYGILQPSHRSFPYGLRELIDRVHGHGMKFGLHLMRGIPREAVRRNTLVKGTQYRARDIADTTSVCSWCPQNYGVDMRKPGAQEYYNSIVNELAGWGVDFIKYDDIVPFPLEVEAVAKAIAQCGRPIVLSLSPGGKIDPAAIDFFRLGNMLRVTHDIWDNQKGLDECFAAWRKWQGQERPGFWIDMDMIPFGQLQLLSPQPETLPGYLPGQGGKKSKSDALFTGHGYTRWSEFTHDEMYTFITMRALAASPLMMGGDLLTLDDFSLRLITDRDMIACNRNGVMGHLVSDADKVEIWHTPAKDGVHGWIGIFNRNADKSVEVRPTLASLGLDAKKKYTLYDVWAGKPFPVNHPATVQPNGAIFLKY